MHIDAMSPGETSPGSLPFCCVMSRGPSMKTTILFSSLPVLSVLAGLGSGMVLAGGPSPAAGPAHLSAPSSGAEAPPSGDAMPAGGDGEAAVADPRPMDRVVQLGRITVPVQKARSVSYVVADFGISMQDGAMAAAFREPQAGLRLRLSFEPVGQRRLYTLVQQPLAGPDRVG
mgnify:CR=1 FL=1